MSPQGAHNSCECNANLLKQFSHLDLPTQVVYLTKTVTWLHHYQSTTIKSYGTNEGVVGWLLLFSSPRNKFYHQLLCEFSFLSCIKFMWNTFQMVNPVNFQFILLKTQGEGTENGSVDILGQLGVGMTYTDSTNRLSMTRTSSRRRTIISVTFSSGLFFDLIWYRQHGDIRNVKVLERYTAVHQSRGIMGSTPSGNCELLSLNMVLEYSNIYKCVFKFVQ